MLNSRYFQAAKYQYIKVDECAYIDCLDADEVQFKTMTNGILEFEDDKITGLGPPVNSNDAVNKSYVDSVVIGDIENLLIVQTDPLSGQFSSIKAAVDSITDASVNNPYLVSVGPGVYTEDTITMKDYVYVRGSGDQETIINIDTPTKTIMIGADNSGVISCGFRGATSGTIIYHEGSGTLVPFLVNNCIFEDCVTIAHSHGASATTILQVENCRLGGTFNYTTGFVATNVGTVLTQLSIQNTIFQDIVPPVITTLATATGTNVALVFSNVLVRIVPTASTTGISIENGAELRMFSVSLRGFETAIKVNNVGSDPKIVTQGISVEEATMDIEINHPGTTGVLNGSFNRDNVSIDDNALLSVFFSDPVNGGMTLVGELYQGDKISEIAEISELLKSEPTMGLFFGGTLSDGGGTTVNVLAGYGYLEDGNYPNNKLIKQSWSNTSIVLSSNSNNYLYFNSSGILSAISTIPDTKKNILLGRVVTNSGTILFIDPSSLNACHYGNKVEIYAREGVGSIYDTGSLVTSNASRNLQVGSGIYFFATTKFTPDGESMGFQFTSLYRNGSGGYTHVFPVTVVDNAFYDDSSGTLAAIPAGEFVKHSLYIIGNPTEKYFLLYGQETFTSEVEAEGGNIPTPPSSFNDGVVLIASIIVEEGNTSIVSIIDERPILGFKASGISSTAIHGNLLGLSANDHPQYLLKDGSAAFSGTLDMGGNSITNVGNVDGVDVSLHGSRHLPNGLDPITTAAPTNDLSATTTNDIGIQNSLARSDHSHAISTGVVITQTPDQTNATGTSSNLARADHVHNIPTANVVTIGTSNSQGSASTFALSDHVHNHGAQTDQTLHAVATTSLNGFMSSTDKTKLDGIQAGATANATDAFLLNRANHTGTQLASTISDFTSATQTVIDADKGIANGIASLDGSSLIPIAQIPKASPTTNLSATTTNSEGTASTVARSDHSHAISTGVVITQTPNQTNATGTSSNLARADHVHNIPTANVVTIGTSNSQGSASTFALSDHVHNHGAQTDQTLHAVATTSLNGFMSSSDKLKLNQISNISLPVPTISNNVNTTYTGAQVAGGLLLRDKTGGGGLTDTFPTASNLVAAIANAQIGSVVQFRVMRLDGGGSNISFAGNTGITFVNFSSGIPPVSANETAFFMIIVNTVSPAAVTIYTMGVTNA